MLAGARSPRVRIVLAAVVLVLTVGLAVVVADRGSATTEVTELADYVPAGVTAVDVTSWATLRDGLEGSGEALLAEASSRDLATRSTLVVSGEVVTDGIGWSPETVDWEAFVQTSAGTAVLVPLPETVATTERRLRELGYQRDGADWVIDLPELRTGGASTPGVFQRVRLLPGGVAVASDVAAVTELIAGVAAGDTFSLADDPAAAHVWARAAALDTFSLQASAAGCGSTDPAEVGPDIAAQADVAVSRAGELLSYRWLLRGLRVEADGADRFEVAMAFDDGATAADQGEVRSRLATGPFIGQTGTVEESIDLVDRRVDGDTAVLDFERQDDAVALMSFVGPLVLASC